MNTYDFFKNVPELDHTERTNPVSQFYYEPVSDPPQNVCVHLSPDAEVDSSYGLEPHEYFKIFTNDVPMCNGYCILPDGIGFSAITIDMPNTTGEMQDWWHPWVVENDLHYKIWLPGMHISHHPIKENLGWGMSFFEPVGRNNPSESDYIKYGLPASPKTLEPNLWSHECGSAIVKSCKTEEITAYITLAHHLVKTNNGFQMRLYAWNGVHIIDGKVHRMIPENEKADIEKVRLFACHNAWEFSRCAQLIERIYNFVSSR